MEFVNLNGSIIESKSPALFSYNRAFRFGDGLFESFPLIDEQVPLWDFHMKRLFKGLQLLQFDLPHHFTPQRLFKETLRLFPGKDNARVRLTVFRSGKGLYAPENDIPEFLITGKKGEDQFTRWTLSGLDLLFYPTPVLAAASGIHNLKSCNSLPYVLAARHAKAHQHDDCLLLNTNHQVVESSNANLFLFSGNELITPPLEAGCVSGTFRSLIFSYFSTLENSIPWKLSEKNLQKEMVLSADEVFLTNAVRGIRWVKRVEQRHFQNEKTKKLHGQLMKFLKL